MKNKKKKILNYSKARKDYLKKIRKDKVIVLFGQLAIFAIFIGLWELLAFTGVLDPFFFSCPSATPSCGRGRCGLIPIYGLD